MENRQSLVTAIAVCYNHSEFVIECLESIKNQTYENIEIIIVDDYSTDDSVAKIKLWMKEKGINCHIILHKQNVGVCKCLNEGLAISNGKYISMVSTDDMWEPEKIETQVEILEEMDEETGVIYSDAYEIDRNGNMLPGTFISHHRQFDHPPEGDLHDILWEGNFIPAMTTLIRRSCFEMVGLYDEDLFYEDWDMWLRISERFRFVYSDKISARYRMLAGSMIRNSYGKVIDSQVKIIRKWVWKEKVNSNLRKTIIRMLAGRAIKSYELGTENCWGNLLLACQVKMSISLLMALSCAWSGIPFSQYNKVMRACRYLIRWRTRE